MKLGAIVGWIVWDASRPVRGAWIETLPPLAPIGLVLMSRPVRGAWIETPRYS